MTEFFYKVGDRVRILMPSSDTRGGEAMNPAYQGRIGTLVRISPQACTRELEYEVQFEDKKDNFWEDEICLVEEGDPNVCEDGNEHTEMSYSSHEDEGGRIIIHVVCKNCGRSGSTTIFLGDVQW